MKRTMRLSLVGAILAMLPVAFAPVVVGQSEAPLDPKGASYWTGTWTPTRQDPPEETSGAGYSEVLILSHGSVEASDPRIEGTWTQNHRIRRYPSRAAGAGDVNVASATARIDNEDGAWVGTFTGFYGESGGEEWNVFQGEGAYEGLTAVFRYHVDGSLEGVIVPGEVPPLPDPVEASTE